MLNPLLSTRSCGILLHPTSLPGPCGIGDLGPAAHDFVRFLRAAGQTWWQMLPIHPVGGGDSPYDSPSAFAGAHLLISPEMLIADGLLPGDALTHIPAPKSPERADYRLASQSKESLLRQAYEMFKTGRHGMGGTYDRFVAEHGSWAWDWALFAALKRHYQRRAWTTWPTELLHRDPVALSKAHETHREEVLYEMFVQAVFTDQWTRLRAHAAGLGVRLLGDVPMFVAHDSADVWANQERFFLDGDGHRTVQAGVPPDYFSQDGQLWGNPLYRWEKMKSEGYSWWVERLGRELQKFDALRLDHFIGLSRYWEVQMGVETAREGRYVDVPGEDFLRTTAEKLGRLPLIAEDLGIVTREVERLRDEFHLPGMKILQFAFNPGAESYLPHRHIDNCVAYTGTHDNNTTRGWYESLLADVADDPTSAAAVELARVRAYSGSARTGDINRSLLRLLMASPANLAIVPFQDLLDQGEEYRMNVPGVAEGNWRYRCTREALSPELAADLNILAIVTERAPAT